MRKKRWGVNVIETLCSKKEFIDLYNKNTVTDLAKKFRVSRQTVILLARKYNLPHKPNGGAIRKHKTITIGVKEFEHLYKTTRTKDLAKKFRVSITTLVKIAKENGIEMKKPGWGIRERKLIIK